MRYSTAARSFAVSLAIGIAAEGCHSVEHASGRPTRSIEILSVTLRDSTIVGFDPHRSLDGVPAGSLHSNMVYGITHAGDTLHVAVDSIKSYTYVASGVNVPGLVVIAAVILTVIGWVGLLSRLPGFK